MDCGLKDKWPTKMVCDVKIADVSHIAPHSCHVPKLDASLDALFKRQGCSYAYKHTYMHVYMHRKI